MLEKRWEHFHHQADIGIRGIGNTKGEAFQQVALALTAVITPPERIMAKDVFEVTCEADEDDVLLLDWLNLLISEMSARGMLFSRYDIWVGTPHLKARVWGEAVDQEKHEPAVEVKGATYHQAKVFQNDDGAWIAQCVVDV